MFRFRERASVTDMDSNHLQILTQALFLNSLMILRYYAGGTFFLSLGSSRMPSSL